METVYQYPAAHPSTPVTRTDIEHALKRDGIQTVARCTITHNMSSHQRSVSQAGEPEKRYFDQQREVLIEEIAMSFEHVLANINKLNRSLEAVTAVGNEFSSVEALWSQFENVMAKQPEQSENTDKPYGDGRQSESSGPKEETGDDQTRVESRSRDHDDDTMK